MLKTPPAKRLSGDERREAIIRAALKVFGEKGFHGATTKALAQEAGVSEALIFRHFPGKEELYEAMQVECCRMKNSSAAEGVLDLDPSTSAVVMIVHYLMAKMLRPPDKVTQEEQSLHRLMVHSFMSDGAFARSFMERVGEGMILKIESCLLAAEAAGDLTSVGPRLAVRGWFAQHFAAMLMLNELPGRPVVDLKLPYPKLVEEATWFALRGLGLKEEAIRTHYNPKAFALLMS